MLVLIHQKWGSFLGSWPAEISWHPRRPAALCEVLACFPRPAQGSVNPSCVSQIPSVFVRQQRGHLLMTFHVFTGVRPGVGGKGSQLWIRQVRKGKLQPVNWDQYLHCVLQRILWAALTVLKTADRYVYPFPAFGPHWFHWKAKITGADGLIISKLYQSTPLNHSHFKLRDILKKWVLPFVSTWRRFNIHRSYIAHPVWHVCRECDEETDPLSHFWFLPLNCDLKQQVVIWNKRAPHWACCASSGLNSDLWLIPFTTSLFKLAVWHSSALISSTGSSLISLVWLYFGATLV